MVPHKAAFVLGLLLVASASARAATIRVRADRPTTQATTSVATADDTVFAAPITALGQLAKHSITKEISHAKCVRLATS